MTGKTNLTVGHKLGIGIGLMLAASAALAVGSWTAIGSLGGEFDAAARRDAGQAELAESVATGASQMLASLTADRQEVSPSAHGKQRKAAVKVAALKFNDQRNLRLAGEIQNAASDLVRLRKAALSAAVESGHSDLSRDRWIIAALAAIVLCVGLAVIWTVRGSLAKMRRMAAELKESAAQIASAASQIASSSQSLAQGASEQAASLEETSASAEEITSMTRRNAENSHTAAEVMAAVDRHVKDGNRTLEQMVVSMHEINASSGKISQIIKVIDEIAFQTNILALNAAVEAARAGEAGMGFAVVADEVRNLAQRSAQAARDTSALIEESIAKSNHGSARLQQVAEEIRAITESAAQVKTLVDEVSVSSQEQSRGVDQISKAIAQMDRVTQSSAANAEESASASEELSAQAGALNGVVLQLRALVGGGLVGVAKALAPPVNNRRPKTLKPAVFRATPKGSPAPAAVAGKPGRRSFPLEDNFTEM